jgi:hypothetical protein
MRADKQSNLPQRALMTGKATSNNAEPRFTQFNLSRHRIF